MSFNPDTKRKIVCDRKTGEHLACVMCGSRYPLPDAVHIIDKKEWKSSQNCDSQENGMPLCPNCHRVFDDILRPFLYRSLKKFGATGLPESWKTSNKNQVTDQEADVQFSNPVHVSVGDFAMIEAQPHNGGAYCFPALSRFSTSVVRATATKSRSFSRSVFFCRFFCRCTIQRCTNLLLLLSSGFSLLSPQ